MLRNRQEAIEWGALSGIPQDTIDALVRYVDLKLPTGGFLEAVIMNDLRESVARADSRNILSLEKIVQWLYKFAPSACWGSPEAWASWLGWDD